MRFRFICYFINGNYGVMEKAILGIIFWYQTFIILSSSLSSFVVIYFRVIIYTFIRCYLYMHIVNISNK